MANGFLSVGRRVLAMLAAATGASAVHAGWAGPYTVNDVRTRGDTGGITFGTVELRANPNQCGSTDFFAIEPANFPKQALALLLSAMISGRKVNVYLPDDGQCSSLGRPKATDVQIVL